jgi:hypothetical protein
MNRIFFAGPSQMGAVVDRRAPEHGWTELASSATITTDALAAAAPVAAALVVDPRPTWSIRRIRDEVRARSDAAAVAVAFLTGGGNPADDTAFVERWLAAVQAIDAEDVAKPDGADIDTTPGLPATPDDARAHLDLTSDLEAPAHARRFTRDTLTAWSAEPYLDVALLVVSELTTNAVQHVRRPVVHLTLGRPTFDAPLTVSVRDRGPSQLPTFRPADVAARDGRGLQIVAQLSRRWGITIGQREKMVWSEIR